MINIIVMAILGMLIGAVFIGILFFPNPSDIKEYKVKVVYDDATIQIHRALGTNDEDAYEDAAYRHRHQIYNSYLDEEGYRIYKTISKWKLEKKDDTK